tara:strand:+ start:646 stop:822 length:177 start_codon:yes stop_codon:yes gene_type:complete
MKAHKLDMIAAWAKENGIRGYEHLDPKEVAKRRTYGVQKTLERERKAREEKESRMQQY